MTEKRRRRKRKPEHEITVEVITNAPVPPDGGWGWVVVMASFFISVIVDGVCFTFGILFSHLQTHFGETKATTSWAGSVLNGTYLSVGVLVSALANRYGCRRVTIAGSIIATCSFFASTFSPNIAVFTLLYGFMAGFGFGLMYLPALVMVGYYFEERRAFATGIAVCGSGIGAFIFAPLIEYLIDIYDWRGALWILAGVAAHGMILGALYRPLDPIITIVEPTDEEVLMSVVSRPNAKQDVTSSSNTQACKLPTIIVTSPESTELLCDVGRENIDTSLEDNDARLLWDDSNCAPSPRNRCMTHDPSTLRSRCESPEVSGGSPGYTLTISESFSTDISNLKIKQEELMRLARSQDFGIHRKTSRDNHAHAVHGFLDVARPLYRRDIFYSGSVYHLPQYMSHSSMNEYVKSVTRVPDDENTKMSKCLKWLHMPKLARDILEDMLDWAILTNITFIIYAVSCTLSMIAFFIPITFLPILAMEIGSNSQQAAFLVSILGITNTVGRVISGVMCDRSWVDSLLVNNIGLILAGIATMAAPLYDTYGLMATYCAFFGICISPFVSLRTVIVVELLGLDKLTNAFGFITMFQGASTFVGVPIAGALSDATGSFDASFYISGLALMLSGSICLPLRRVKKWETTRRKRRSASANKNDESYELNVDM